jgi:hypothetical protein
MLQETKFLENVQCRPHDQMELKPVNSPHTKFTFGNLKEYKQELPFFDKKCQEERNYPAMTDVYVAFSNSI